MLNEYDSNNDDDDGHSRGNSYVSWGTVGKGVPQALICSSKAGQNFFSIFFFFFLYTSDLNIG